MIEEVAPIPFLTLNFCGLWRPPTWTTWRRMMYNGYTVLMLIILVTIALTVGVGVGQMSFSDELFAETVFLMFALINANFKAFNVLFCRKLFVRMLEMIQDDRWYKLHDAEEIEINQKYGKTIRKISVYFTSAVFVAIMLRVIAPLLDTSGEIKLPVSAYCPCNIEHSACYWLLFIHQAVGTGVATLTHAAKDCIISAMLLQTCAQLEILKHRLLSVTTICGNARERNEPEESIEAREKSLIGDCIKDHESIFEFAKILNSSLNVMLFGQIAVTIPNLCLSIYLLSSTNIASMDFVMTTQFFSAVVIELFFFCWYGNEVTLHSLDIESVVSEMDWTVLSVKGRKDLIMIMVRSSRPILFRVGPIMNMNIDSFLKIMKTSYSAFSVLQSTD